MSVSFYPKDVEIDWNLNHRFNIVPVPNFPNGNAACVIEILGMAGKGEPFYYGELACERIPEIQSFCQTLIEDDAVLNTVLKDIRPDWIGYEDVLRARLKQMDELFTFAHTAGKGIHWA